MSICPLLYLQRHWICRCIGSLTVDSLTRARTRAFNDFFIFFYHFYHNTH